MCSPRAYWGKGPRQCYIIQRELVRLEVCRRGSELEEFWEGLSRLLFKRTTRTQMDLLGLAGVAGVCFVLTALVASALWTSGDSVREISDDRSGRSWESRSYVLLLLIVFDLLLLTAFFKTWKQARKRAK